MIDKVRIKILDVSGLLYSLCAIYINHPELGGNCVYFPISMPEMFHSVSGSSCVSHLCFNLWERGVFVYLWACAFRLSELQ